LKSRIRPLFNPDVQAAEGRGSTNAAIDFFKWALESGQPEATSLDYVPFPPNVVQQIENYWKAQFAGLKG